MTASFDPLWMFRPFGIGEVSQRINPGWFSPTFNFAGDAKIEEQVVADVASYGTQVGWLNDIVLALARKQEPAPAAVAKLAEAVKKIEYIKQTRKSAALSAAVDALNYLKNTDPELYQKLIQDRNV
ncbi:hypothetical protein [Rugamonas sp.]|uniref:hypothetical protein n=1 Tax=Rugamonas sp. TaxID=1926287 RepID=UPI0025D5C92E|nr:hypothetical protein [Rugamonas sp.]